MRSRIMVALAAWLCMLAVVGGYGISVSLAAGFDMRAVRTLHEQLFMPTEQLVDALQQERRLSLEYLGSGRSAGRDALEQQAGKTDEAGATFRRLAGGDAVQEAASPALKNLINTMGRQVGELGALRESILDGGLDRNRAAATFTADIDTAFRIYRATPIPDTEPALPEHHQGIIALQRARELLAQEVSQLAGVLASGRLTARDQATATQLVASQRSLFREAEALLDGDRLASYQRVATGAAFVRLRGLEDDLTRPAKEPSGDEQSGNNEDQTTPPVSASTWSAAGVAAIGELRALDTAFANEMLSLSDAAADDVFLQTGIVAGVGLVIVALFVLVWVQVAPRHVATQLGGLKEAALTLAHERLPRVVTQLSHGERVDVDTAAPALEFGPDEFGDVGRAFNAVQQTAVQTAIDQAELRHGVRDVFVALARRSQGLIRRQLTMIDAMERKASDPDELEQLFAIDHLATRMQRFAEALIILSGDTPGRRWRNPVPVVDVIRGAVGEVENYSRVTMLPVPQAAIAGHAVADVIHLVAELTENATAYSPPHTKVRIGADLVPAGLVIELEDAGLGMSDEDLDMYNRRLAEAPEWTLPDARRLGLFVVARLAARHAITVHLRGSPYGGTTAIVLVPETLVSRADSAKAIEAAGTGAHAVPEPAEMVAATAVARPEAHHPPVPEPRSFPEPGNATPPAAAPILTEDGLPHRVRQANLAAPLREESPPPVDDAAAPRPPEEIRAMMSAFQRGTVQGRAAARKVDQPE